MSYYDDGKMSSQYLVLCSGRGSCQIDHLTMYIPSAFLEESPERLAAFVAEHSFATLVTHDGKSGFASHLPVLFHPEKGPRGTLIAHMARANEQWTHFANGQEVLVVFQGPHAYISPSCYQTRPAVPTWNYAAVHVYGTPTIVPDPDSVISILERTTQKFESLREEPWPGILPVEFRDKLLPAIIAFEIPISRIEGKFKLGQNRTPEDLFGVYQALSASSNAGENALAKTMLEAGYSTELGRFTGPK